MKKQRTVLCGLLVLTRQRELLLARSAAERRWSIPLARQGDLRSARQVAIDAFGACTGLALSADTLVVPVGRYVYDPRTDLMLHAVASDRVDLSALATMHAQRSGIAAAATASDALTWAPYDELERLCAAPLARLLAGLVPPSALLERLAQAGPRGRPRPARPAADASDIATA